MSQQVKAVRNIVFAVPAPQLISVVMPVRDGEAHVAQQLAALAMQRYRGRWELVVSDNGCRDRTIEIVRSFASRLPAITVADATARPGLNHARNVGVAAARGDFIAFCDADDVAAPDWLQELAGAAADADIVGGRLEWESLNDPVVQAWRAQKPMTDLLVDHGFLRYAPGGNMGVWTRVAREIGWEEQFTFGSSDHGFAWRAQLAGYRLVFAPDAVMRQRFRSTVRSMARQQFNYGRSGPALLRAYRGLGLPKPDNRKALLSWYSLLRTAPDLWRSRALRGRWIRKIAFRIGRVVGSLQVRLLCL
jgi:glycosyltransferase involved in cell wall biosynthesis